MCIRNVLTIVAVAMLALATAANAEQMLISVSLDTTERDEITLDGPVDGVGGSDVGTTWTQILAGPGFGVDVSRTDLVDSTGAATAVDFSVDGTVNMWDWGTPDLLMLTSGILGWVPIDNPYDLVFSGLTPGVKYDLYIASFHPNENGSRALFSTTNATTTESPQIADNGGLNGNDSTWVEGENYVLFENMLPDGNGEIIIHVYSDWATDSTKRAYVSGFQLTTSIIPTIAADPDPADEVTDVPRDVVLNWTPGEFANTHNVYLGAVFDNVNDAVLADAVSAGQTATTYDPPGRLDFGQTYYWRIDEVNAPPDSTIFKGDVWSFTTEPVGYPIDGANITATASSSMDGSSPQKTVDGSGLDDSDLHSMNMADTWLSNLVGTQPTWIEYQFDKVYKLHEMWVWNQNQVIEPSIGYGFKDVTIEYSVDGIAYTTLGTTHEFARGPGASGYAANTTVDFAGAAAKYVKLTANSNWGGILDQFGLSEVRFFNIPVLAREPSPDSGATDVGVDAALAWRAGREAERHEVYLSTDEQAVIDGTAPVVTVTETSYSTSLDIGSTYYWRVDEVNDAEATTTWQGEIWNLSTPEFLVVDDFESYNDIAAGEEGSNLVYLTWIDGFDNPSVNGATVGYTVPFEPSMESVIVHGGEQAMPFLYSNNGGATYSEAERTFADPQDWTKAGIQTLVLYLRADSLSGALDTTFSLTTDGSADWFSQAANSYYDGDAAQSGAISDNQESLMQTTVSGAGTVSFYWKVSSEADWDFLEFYIDDSLQDQISGEVDFQQMTYAITGSGSHTLEWRYMKDAGASGGEDTGWVDKFEWDGAGQPAVMPGNTGQLYVKVNGVKAAYPGNVADIPWMKWNIDLASLGANLQNVTTLAVGIDGNGASGTLYFDDFRLESGE